MRRNDMNSVPNKFLCLLLVFAFVAGCAPRDNEKSPLEAAEAALSQGQLIEAKRLASQIAEGEPDWVEAQRVLGDAAYRARDTESAVRHYDAIRREASPAGFAAATAVAGILHLQGRLHESIRVYAEVAPEYADDERLQKTLASLYAVTGQRRRADEVLTALARSPGLDLRSLVLLSDFDRRDPEAVNTLKECLDRVPDDPAVNLGLAVEDIHDGNHDAARHRLQQIVEAAPDLEAAQGLLGELLVDGDDTEFLRWHAALPETVYDAPEVWSARGLWAQKHGESRVAARCLWEYARHVPASHRAMQQLGLVMAQEEPEVGRGLLARAEQIYEFRQSLSKVLNSQRRDESALQQVISRLSEMGRDWEAWHWARMAQETHPRADWVQSALEQFSSLPNSDAPRIRKEQDLLAALDLSHGPDFEELIPKGSPASTSPRQEAGVTFVDEATSLGLDFVYHHGRTADAKGVRMQESTGGGVAVLDYDCDGHPDLFITQGEDWRHGEDTPSPSDQYEDRLFHNQKSGFVDVTEQAGLLPEDGFGQGCSAGDFNNDGFVDVYVANIRINRLLVNNGDGTFSDVTAAAGLMAHSWTTSCLIADLNADGLPDLFDVNYLEGEGLYRKVCDEDNCTPQQHSSATDELHLSRGDGGFDPFDVGGEQRWGAGLGLVAFCVDLAALDDLARDNPQGPDVPLSGQPAASRLSLFIANDHEPNFFLSSKAANNGSNLELSDNSFVSGLAVNRDGRPMACMGVASGDVNSDGLTDLFVTNYKGEANNMYLQSSGGVFTDAIAGTGLMAPGLPYVGWGTQFLDADNDGRLDLAVANGHVGDFQKEGLECYMPTQFFHQTSDRRFTELAAEQVGPYFAMKLLGRSLATLDWNQDGLTDLVHAPIAAPLALLTNQTTGAGRFLIVRLQALSTARDAIGAVVTVTTGAGEVTQQLTGGDGYQVTNERVLRFGLGDQSEILRVVIEWPGGLVETIEHPPTNSFVHIVEGQGWEVLWQRDTP